MTTFLTRHDDISAWVLDNARGPYKSLTVEDGMINCDGSISLRPSWDTELPVKFNLVTGTFDASNRPQLESWAGFPNYSLEILAYSTKIKSASGINDHVKSCENISMDRLSSNGLGLLLIDDLSRMTILSGDHRANRAHDIIYGHFRTRDIFACQQELIDNDLAEWATL